MEYFGQLLADETLGKLSEIRHETPASISVATSELELGRPQTETPKGSPGPNRCSRRKGAQRRSSLESSLCARNDPPQSVPRSLRHSASGDSNWRYWDRLGALRGLLRNRLGNQGRQSIQEYDNHGNSPTATAGTCQPSSNTTGAAMKPGQLAAATSRSLPKRRFARNSFVCSSRLVSRFDTRCAPNTSGKR